MPRLSAASSDETLQGSLFAEPEPVASAAGGGGDELSGLLRSAGDVADEEVDIDALARAHIEELLQNEPERVSALLSRWALSEDRFAETSAS